MAKCGKTKSAVREAQVKTRFYVSGKVQDVGCRGFIIAEMLNYGFREGAAINLPDGRVEVGVKGTREKIEDFKVKLSKGLRNEFGADTKIENSGLHVPELEVMPLTEGAQAHLLLQFKKATDELGKMRKELGGKIDALPKKIAETTGELGKMREDLGGKIDSLGGKIDSLPAKIAFELKKNQN